MPLEAGRTKFSLKGVTAGRFYSDEVLSVSAVPNAQLTGDVSKIRFGEEPNSGQAWSYILEAEGKRVGFSGDISGSLKGRAMDHLLGQEFDLLVMEMTHIHPRDVLPAVGRGKIGRLVLIHIHDPWHGEGEEELAGYCGEHLPFPFTIAHDGMALDL